MAIKQTSKRKCSKFQCSKSQNSRGSKSNCVVAPKQAQAHTPQSNAQSSESAIEQVVIIGAGIAGLTAAIYTARANLSPVVICGPQDGGQLTETTEVENFPGFEHGIMGPDLMTQTRKQAQRFGTRYITGAVKNVTHTDGVFSIELDAKKPMNIQSHVVIVATGASARWLNIPTEAQFKGRGVSACATCDGFFFKEKSVFVVGGGDSAMEEASFLSKFAKPVTIVHRKDTFRASKIMQDRALTNPKISVLWNKEIIEYVGDKKLTSVILNDTVTQQKSTHAIDGVFLAIGHKPNSDFVAQIVERDPVGYIIAGSDTKTKIPGLFACGDVADAKYRQAITAAGSGCIAALEAERYLAHK